MAMTSRSAGRDAEQAVITITKPITKRIIRENTANLC
jgi:hypothetical protein